MSGGDYSTDQYVKWAVEGGGWDKGMGTFQVFYGSSPAACVLTPEPAQNLGNDAVLRRQIEEYSKLRAPAIIAELLMDKLDTFERVQEDAKVIKKKLEVDDGVEELEKYYKKIYNSIEKLEDCGIWEDTIMSDVSNTAASIQNRLGSMKSVKDDYKAAMDEYDVQEEILATATDEEVIKAAQEREKELLEEMEHLEQEYGGYWKLIQKDSKALQDNCNKYNKNMMAWIQELDNLMDHCEKAEKKKEDLKEKIQELRDTLDSSKCTRELSDGLTKPEEGAADGKSILERYEALLEHDIVGMGQAMYDHDTRQILETRKIINEANLAGILLVHYRDVNRDGFYPLERDSSDCFPEALSQSTLYLPYGKESGQGYKRFAEAKSPESQEFWNELKKLYDDSEKGAKKKKLEDAVTKIFEKAQDTFKGLFGDDALRPEGAEKLIGGTDDSNPSTGTKFGTEDDWGGKNEGKKELEKSLDGDFLQKLSNTASEAGNKLLLLAYDTEMFSDLSTPGKDEEGYPKENMAGIPMSIDVNYYFQSELEYLYNGNLADAMDNLKSVGGMLFLVRFIFNYVASFSVESVNSIVSSVKGALSWLGPFAILAGELTRLGLAIGESALDVSRLRDGDKVAIFKTGDTPAKPGTWKLSISGIIDIGTKGLEDSALDAAFNTGKQNMDDDGATLSYTDYMRLFLLLVPGDTLAGRTRNLIELNVTNYDEGINAVESDMANAERYDLGKLFTGFTLTTTADLRMLFLSMPLAQQGVNGVIPPKTLPVTVTDYRGY